LDLYKPFPINDDIAIEENILTVRAVVVGVVLGCLVNASNLYLGNVPDTFSYFRILTFPRFEDWLHIQLHLVRGYFRLRYNQVTHQMDSRDSDTWWWRNIWAPRERYHSICGNWGRRNCWTLCCWPSCDVQVGFVKS
jgi:hypothetical protein